MKVGMFVAMQNHPNNSHADHHLYWEECRLADLAERSLRRFAAEVLPELKQGEEHVGEADSVQVASS